MRYCSIHFFRKDTKKNECLNKMIYNWFLGARAHDDKITVQNLKFTGAATMSRVINFMGGFWTDRTLFFPNILQTKLLLDAIENMNQVQP